MKFHLLLDHTAYFENDEKNVVSVEPECSGRLEIEGHPMRVPVTGAIFSPRPELIGHVRVLFITDGGTVYRGIRTVMDKGVPVSRPDAEKDYKEVRLRLDALQREMERLTEAFHKLSAECKHDALGFLTHNVKHTEVKEK
jgi:hypothetical protein